MVKNTYIYFWQVCVAISWNFLKLQTFQHKTWQLKTVFKYKKIMYVHCTGFNKIKPIFSKSEILHISGNFESSKTADKVWKDQDMGILWLYIYVQLGKRMFKNCFVDVNSSVPLLKLKKMYTCPIYSNTI